MDNHIYLFVISCIFVSTVAVPFQSETQIQEALLHRSKRKATKGDLWPEGVIPYAISKSIQRNHRFMRVINEAIRQYQENTCIQFEEYSEAELEQSGFADRNSYAYFVPSRWCSSAMGAGREPSVRKIQLAGDCATTPILVHELGHLIGMWHEQARMDRENHVIVMVDNLQDQTHHNFKIEHYMDLLTPYDYTSIMHYSLKMFSKNNKATIDLVNPGLEGQVGTQNRLSFYDIKTVNLMYDCAERCPHPRPKCQNEGFLVQTKSGHCMCKCPKGLVGESCERVHTDLEWDPSNKCGGTIDVTDRAFIESPDGKVNNNAPLTCTWLIKSPKDTKMELEIKDIQMKIHPRVGCMKDNYVEIRNSAIGIETGRRICDKKEATVFKSSTDTMIVQYVTADAGHNYFDAEISVVSGDDCASSPCLNGGTCVSLEELQIYYCSCPDKLLGARCEKRIIDGGFSMWSDWQPCASACGFTERYRECNNPEPQNGGKHCDGLTMETKPCHDPHQSNTCKNQVLCTFGTSSEIDDCDVNMKPSSGISWQFGSGATKTQKTGPFNGHTTGLSDDEYIFIEGSEGETGDTASFWLPEVKRIQKSCLQFFYHMYGDHIGKLEVIRRRGKSGATIWARHGNHGNTWQEGHVDVIMHHGIEVGFVGTKGDGYLSDIALDDISISPGSCRFPDEDLVKNTDSLVEENLVTADRVLPVGSGPRKPETQRPPKDQGKPTDTSTKAPFTGCRFKGKKFNKGPFVFTKKNQSIRCFCIGKGIVKCDRNCKTNFCKQILKYVSKRDARRQKRRARARGL